MEKIKQNKSIIFVASGMNIIKKDYMKRNLENYYLNYSALGLATILSKKGYDVKVYQGDYTHPEEFAKNLPDLSNAHYPLLLSIPSFLAIDWCISFTKEIKKLYPNIKILAGGRWVIDLNQEWCKKQLPNVDQFLFGCGDEYIDEAIELNLGKTYKGDSPAFKELDYTLLNNFKMYQPVIEVSRGCFGKCEFCLESRYKTYNLKKPEDVINEAINICKLYGDEELNIYFESAIFNPTEEWSLEFERLYKENSLKFKWRATTRVDVFNTKTITPLSNSGLIVLDLGLESGSKKQLLSMGKTKNPDFYLSKASKLIKALHMNNVWVKLNILLYLQETSDTLMDTYNFLKSHREYIKGLSVNPLTIYLNGPTTNDYIDEISKTLDLNINHEDLIKNGYTYIPLSKNISVEKAKSISKQIADEFMTPDDYIDLKKVCYTKRHIK